MPSRPGKSFDSKMFVKSPVIEKDRQETIRRNLQELKAAGIDITQLKTMATALYGVKQKPNGERTKEGRKDKLCQGADDDEYLPPQGESLSSCSEDDESSRSLARKAKGMGPRGKRGNSTTEVLRKSRRLQQESGAPMEGALPNEPTANHANQLPPSPIDGSNPHSSMPKVGGSTGSTSIPSKKNVRGPTRGINMDKVRKKLCCRIPVEIDRESMAITGEYASSVASALGEAIRAHAPVKDIGWGKIDFGIKESILLRVGNIFALGDYKNDMVLRRIIDVKCQSLYRGWKSTLYRHYKKIKEEVPDPKNYPLSPCDSNDWKFMIKKVWRKKAFKEKSKRGANARKNLKYNHTSGSQSYVARASIFVQKNKRAQTFLERFKDTHICHRQGEEVWIDEKAKKDYDEIEAKIYEQAQLGVINPQSEVQASVDVLGKRSGYLKGYGILKSAYAVVQSQEVSNSKVVALEQVVADQAKVIADYAKKFETMMLAMAMKSGIDPATIPGLSPSSEEENTLAGQQDGTS